MLKSDLTRQRWLMQRARMVREGISAGKSSRSDSFMMLQSSGSCWCRSERREMCGGCETKGGKGHDILRMAVKMHVTRPKHLRGYWHVSRYLRMLRETNFVTIMVVLAPPPSLGLSEIPIGFHKMIIPYPHLNCACCNTQI